MSPSATGNHTDQNPEVCLAAPRALVLIAFGEFVSQTNDRIVERTVLLTAHKRDYENIITELYYEAAESLKGVSLVAPPNPLEVDLTEREFKFVNRAGKTKKILEPKEDFKKRTKRSPDDGDGLVLALGPDYCFQNVTIELVSFLDVKPETQETTVDELRRVLGLT